MRDHACEWKKSLDNNHDHHTQQLFLFVIYLQTIPQFPILSESQSVCRSDIRPTPVPDHIHHVSLQGPPSRLRQPGSAQKEAALIPPPVCLTLWRYQT
jgi:hypothetical protein